MKTDQAVINSNDLLKRNLQTYFARYPEDIERIVPIATRKIPQDFKLPSYVVTDPCPDYKPRIGLIAGIFDPKTMVEIDKKWKSNSYFIVESDPDIIAYQFQNSDLTNLIKAPIVFMFLGYDKVSLVAPMQKVMRQSMHASRLRLTQILCHDLQDPNMKPECRDLYQHIIQIFSSTTEHVFFNFGNLFDSLEGLRATLANSKFLEECGGINEIENLHKGKSFVVVGAGPSLDKDIELLKANQDKFIIIAVDAAARVLEVNDIRYDYVTSIERFNVLQDKFFRGLKPSKAELVAYPVVHTEVLKLWPGKIRIAYRNYAWFAYFEKNWPKGILESGGSASHLATKLAYFLGADTVFLLGCDMSYEQVGDLYRSHCQSLAYPEWAKLISVEEMDKNPDFGVSYLVEANDGSMVRTNQVYHQWAKEYASISLAMNLGIRLGNCSAKGIKIPGVEYVSFAEVCEAAKKINDTITPHNPPHSAGQAGLSKPLKHTELIANLKGYLKHCQDAFDLLYRSGETGINEEAFQLCYSIFYGKLAYETLFTAFIIQNCASEFFTAETYLNALDNTDPLEKRAAALAGIFKIVSNTLGYTIELLEEAEAGKIRDKVVP